MKTSLHVKMDTGTNADANTSTSTSTSIDASTDASTDTNANDRVGILNRWDQYGVTAEERRERVAESVRNILRPPALRTDLIAEQLPLMLPIGGVNLLAAMYPYLGQDSASFEGTDADESPYRQVVSEEGKDSIIETKHHGESIQCPITLSEIKEGDPVATLPCGHHFNPEGLKKWLTEYDVKCPVCRASLPSKEIRVVPEQSESPNYTREDYDAIARADTDSTSSAFDDWDMQPQLMMGRPVLGGRYSALLDILSTNESALRNMDPVDEID